jgi:hypothetical protein
MSIVLLRVSSSNGWILLLIIALCGTIFAQRVSPAENPEQVNPQGDSSGIINLIAFRFSAQDGQDLAFVKYVQLNWIQGTSNPACGSLCPITSNNVYRCTGPGCTNYSLLYSSTVPLTGWNDTAVVQGNTYDYVVTAVSTCEDTTNATCQDGTSAESAESSPATASP